METTLKLLGLSTTVNSCGVEMYFTNGEVKSCYETDLGFKINNNIEKPMVNIKGFKDKQEWDGTKHIVVGKDEKEIVSCIIEAKKETIENYMFKLGVFSDNVEINRDLISDRFNSNFEGTISNLSSSISMLEHEISKMNEEK